MSSSSLNLKLSIIINCTVICQWQSPNTSTSVTVEFSTACEERILVPWWALIGIAKITVTTFSFLWKYAQVARSSKHWSTVIITYDRKLLPPFK